MRTEYEFKQLSGWWFDLSKLTIGSFGIKLLDSTSFVSFNTFVIFLATLIASISCARMGVRFAKKVRS